MDELIQAMSIDQLETFKTQYSDNENIIKIVDGYIEAKKREIEQAEAKAQFEKQIAKLASKLPHPNNVGNVYLAWREVAEEDTTQEAEVVYYHGDTVVATEEESDRQETRYPIKKVEKWCVEVNKGFQVKSGSKPSTSKRKIKNVYRRESDGKLTLIEVDTPMTTWTEWIDYLNEHPGLLYTNADGSPIKVIRTTASGLVDLKAAGFVGIEAN